MKDSTRAWMALLALLTVAACGRQTAYLTDQEKQNVNELTQNMKAHCVGRYLIDMPYDVLLSGGATVDGVEIESTAMSHAAYSREIESRGAELRGKVSIDSYPFLYADDVVDGPDTHYFVYRGNLSDGPARRVFEAYKWDRGYRFKLGVEGRDYLHPDQTYKPYIEALEVKNDIPEKTRLVFDIIRRIRTRKEDEIPTDPGLCFLGGLSSWQSGGARGGRSAVCIREKSGREHQILERFWHSRNELAVATR
ncbi:hypothetical protein [Burkholderia territorii]|uniref:hypothetical protein n=1 Tax=Burkholderia territorii TaxID=1503055 RepID=UPI0012DA8009|nr:hypothetical protein [Burkholderia territorii]